MLISTIFFGVAMYFWFVPRMYSSRDSVSVRSSFLGASVDDICLTLQRCVVFQVDYSVRVDILNSNQNLGH